jgi:peptidyl-prolyl cis-trans isomerase C
MFSKRMRNHGLAGALVLAAGGAVLAQAPAASDKGVARIDGVEIRESDLTVAADDLGAQVQQMPDAQRREYLVGYLADLKAGARAAEAEKLGETADFKRRLAYMRDKLLIDELLLRETKKAITPEAVKALYDETAKGLQPEEEVRARHILVEKEEEAKAVHQRVTKGNEDFAKVAAELSKDPGSGKEGGDLGYFTKERMVSEFAEAAFKLGKGDISAPVKSQFGWHVIKVEDRRTKPVPKLEDVRPQIEAHLSRKAQTDFIMALRQKTKVERLDKPAETAPQPAKP